MSTPNVIKQNVVKSTGTLAFLPTKYNKTKKCRLKIKEFLKNVRENFEMILKNALDK